MKPLVGDIDMLALMASKSKRRRTLPSTDWQWIPTPGGGIPRTRLLPSRFFVLSLASFKSFNGLTTQCPATIVIVYSVLEWLSGALWAFFFYCWPSYSSPYRLHFGRWSSGILITWPIHQRRRCIKRGLNALSCWYAEEYCYAVFKLAMTIRGCVEGMAIWKISIISYVSCMWSREFKYRNMDKDIALYSERFVFPKSFWWLMHAVL